MNTTKITTRQAADFLNVSHAYVIKIIESGEIPFHRDGTELMVSAHDLCAFHKKQSEKSEQALQDLAKEAQELDLGY